MKRWICLLLLTSLGLAQSQPEKSEAIVSFIEDLASPEAVRKDPRRLIAFVELIHQPSFEECQRKGFTGCPKFEFYAPILPEGLALDYEKVLVRAWLRLVVRSSLRLQLEVGSLPPVVCAVGAFDLSWYLYTGQALFPKEDFCDGFGSSVLPNCFWECDLPTTLCPSPASGCINCVAKGYARASQRLYAYYYPDYLKTGLEALFKQLPTGVLWGDWDKLDFTYTQPVGNFGLPNLSAVIDLARRAQQDDARGGVYITQSGIYNIFCQPSAALLGSGGKVLLEALKILPGESLDPQRPGLAKLEELKRGLADRESAGDSVDRTLKAIVNWDGHQLEPRYVRPLSAQPDLLTTRAEARKGTTTPSQYACLGYATLFMVRPKLEQKTIGGGLRSNTCFPNQTLVPFTLVPVPRLLLVAPRLHTDWQAVPEGYPVPGVVGKPQY